MMKKLKIFAGLLVVTAMLWASNLTAQDEGTYIDNASSQDSSYVESDALSFDDMNQKDSGNTALYVGIVAGIIVAGAVVFFLNRKKKKK